MHTAPRQERMVVLVHWSLVDHKERCLSETKGITNLYYRVSCIEVLEFKQSLRLSPSHLFPYSIPPAPGWEFILPGGSLGAVVGGMLGTHAPVSSVLNIVDHPQTK